MFWGLKNVFIYCGDKFGDFCKNVGDFFIRTPGHTDSTIGINTKIEIIHADNAPLLKQLCVVAAVLNACVETP